MTEKYQPVNCDRVRVVLEGEVLHAQGDSKFWVGANLINPKGGHVVSIEKIEPPVEVFGPGDIVREKGSNIPYLICQDGHFVNAETGHRSHGDDYIDHFTSEYYEKVDIG